MNPNNRFTARRLCINAILIAMFVVLDFFSVTIGNTIKLTFASFAMLVAALCFGTTDALLVAFCGEFLYQLLSYGLGPTTLLWIAPVIVHAFVVGVYSDRHDNNLTLKQTATIIFIGSLITSIVTTGVIWLDARIFGYNSNLTVVIMIARFANAILLAVIYTMVLPGAVMLIRRACKLGTGAPRE